MEGKVVLSRADLEYIKFYMVHSTEGWNQDGRAEDLMAGLLKRIDCLTGEIDPSVDINDPDYGYHRIVSPYFGTRLLSENRKEG